MGVAGYFPAQRERKAQRLQTVTRHSRKRFADDRNGIVGSRIPDQQTAAVKALLKKCQVKPRIVRHELAVFGKFDKWRTDVFNRRRTGHHLRRVVSLRGYLRQRLRCS